MASEWTQIIEPGSQYDEHGMKERMLSTKFCHLRVGFSCDPLKGDDWARRKALEWGGFESPKWRREQCIDYKAHSGQRIWPMFNRKVHNAIWDVSECSIFRVIDQGIRHPTVCLWVAVNAKGDRHVFREYYASNRSIAQNCRAILKMSQEKVSGSFIDPSTRKRSQESLTPLITLYEQNGIYCIPADNSFVGYDAVCTAATSTIAREAIRTGIMPEYLEELEPDQNQLLKIADKPALTFDLRFASRAYEQCAGLRWQQQTGDPTQTGTKEKPVDVDDDGSDCVRYALQSGLYYRKPSGSNIQIVPFKSIGQLQKAKRNATDFEDKQNRRAYL